MTDQTEDLTDEQAAQIKAESPEIEPDDADVLGEEDDTEPEEVDQ